MGNKEREEREGEACRPRGPARLLIDAARKPVELAREGLSVAGVQCEGGLITSAELGDGGQSQLEGE